MGWSLSCLLDAELAREGAGLAGALGSPAGPEILGLLATSTSLTFGICETKAFPLRGSPQISVPALYPHHIWIFINADPQASCRPRAGQGPRICMFRRAVGSSGSSDIGSFGARFLSSTGGEHDLLIWHLAALRGAALCECVWFLGSTHQV